MAREHKDANLVISRRPSCFGSDGERASGEKDAEDEDEDEEAGWSSDLLPTEAWVCWGRGKKSALFILFSCPKSKPKKK